MHDTPSQAQLAHQASRIVLGVDTCGPSGSVALGRIDGQLLEILGQAELAGRSYSAKLVAAVGELLGQAGLALKQVDAIVAVNGPGSFTGVRVGLSAVKGLAEPTEIPVAAVSRLEVLARNAGSIAAALDAHRHEVFLRVPGRDGEAMELLAGHVELADTAPPAEIAVCDEAASALLEDIWPGTRLLTVPPPMAADALRLAMPGILAGRFMDLALLDGHYLRRSDAEIFGDPIAASKSQPIPRHPSLLIRPMAETDLDAVIAIAQSLPEAPDWNRTAYLSAVDPRMKPRRISLVAEDPAVGIGGFVIARLTPPEAELETIAVDAPLQRRGIARRLFASLSAELRRLHVAEVSLEVRASNRAARTLYAAIGFSQSGGRPRYYSDPVEDAVLMHQRLV